MAKVVVDGICQLLSEDLQSVIESNSGPGYGYKFIDVP
jgi:hypothetical protein